MPELALRIASATPTRQRDCAVAVALWAVRVTDVDREEAVRVALPLLHEGLLSVVNFAALQELVDHLDNEAWKAHDAVEVGDETYESYLGAFRLARAAATVFFAAQSDPKLAALEAVYEASVVDDDAGSVEEIAFSKLD
jgi:hypothetical protein